MSIQSLFIEMSHANAKLEGKSLTATTINKYTTEKRQSAAI